MAASEIFGYDAVFVGFLAVVAALIIEFQAPGGLAGSWNYLQRELFGKQKTSGSGYVKVAAPETGAKIVSSRWDGLRRVAYGYKDPVEGETIRVQDVPEEFVQLKKKYLDPKDGWASFLVSPSNAVWVFDYDAYRADLLGRPQGKEQSVEEAKAEFQEIMDRIYLDEQLNELRKTEAEKTLAALKAQRDFAVSASKIVPGGHGKEKKGE